MIKNILRVLLVAAVFLALAFVGLIFLVNPNQFRGAIEQAVLDNTGYELRIAGDLDLQFTPYIGITLHDVRLRNPASPQELASTSSVALRVDPGLLLQGELLISEFRADDFHVNYFTDTSGINIWNVQAPNGSTAGTIASSSTTPAVTPQAAQTQAGENNIRTSFERIRISNASVDIQDLTAGTRYSINNLNLESRNVSLDGVAFPLELDFVFLNNGISAPQPMGLRSSVRFNQSAGNLNLDDINFNLTPVLLQGQITASGLNDSLRYEGALNSNQFEILDLLQSLNFVETNAETDVPAISSQPPVTMAMSFDGDQSQISISSLTLAVGNTNMRASGNMRFATAFEPSYVSYELISNELDITPFMTTPVEDTEPANGSADTTNTTNSDAPAVATSEPADTPLPLELLNSLNVLGSISIESVTAREMVFSDINIFTNLEDGVLDIESQPITAFEGTVLGNMRLDARGGTGKLTTQLATNQLNLANITPAVSRLNSVTGKLDMEANYTAEGTTTQQLLNSLSGSTSFAIIENSVDIGVIKQAFTAIAALSTTGEAIQQWPDVIRFQEFTGYLLLEDGITENQQVKLRMDNFDITGTGGLDFAAKTFDYDLLFTVLGDPFVQTIPMNPRYHDISWPVQCSSAFEDSVTQYCRPDFAEVRLIFSQMGTNEVRRRLDDVVTDQVPEQLQDSARGLLRNIFQ